MAWPPHGPTASPGVAPPHAALLSCIAADVTAAVPNGAALPTRPACLPVTARIPAAPSAAEDAGASRSFNSLVRFLFLRL